MDKQFERNIGLLGEEKYQQIQDKTICVIGLGGVGGTALEALARTGFKKFIIIDFDKVDPSNLNRQILYIQDDISNLKVEAAKRRILSINKEADIKDFNLRVEEDSLKVLNDYQIDFIIDAIDDVKGKVAIAKFALARSVPLIVSLGMANRFDPSQVKIERLDKTTQDPLARKLRYEVKKAGLDAKEIYACVSKETPKQDGTKLNSIMTVPSSAGLNIAYYCIKHFIS